MPKWIIEPTATEYGYISVSTLPFMGENNITIHLDCEDNPCLRDLLLTHLLLTLLLGDYERMKRLLRIAEIKEELYQRNLQTILALKRTLADDEETI